MMQGRREGQDSNLSEEESEVRNPIWDRKRLEPTREITHGHLTSLYEKNRAYALPILSRDKMRTSELY